MDCFDDPSWRHADTTWGEPPLVIESACRRPGWTSGGAVPLAGRLVLHLPKLDAPTVRVFPLMRTHGPDLPASLAAWEAAGDEASFRAWYGPASLIAAGLLAANYAHNPHDLAQLFPQDIDEAIPAADALRGPLGAQFGDWLASRPEADDVPGMFDYGQAWFHDSWSLEDPPEVQPAPLIETRRRLACWSPGAPIPLAIPGDWRLPVLDLATIATVPDLRDEVLAMIEHAAEGLRMTAELPQPVDPIEWARTNRDYVRQVVRVAVLLLASNYDLPYGDRGRLLPDVRTPEYAQLFIAAAPPLSVAVAGPWGPALTPTIPGSGLDLTIN